MKSGMPTSVRMYPRRVTAPMNSWRATARILRDPGLISGDLRDRRLRLVLGDHADEDLVEARHRGLEGAQPEAALERLAQHVVGGGAGAQEQPLSVAARDRRERREVA